MGTNYEHLTAEERATLMVMRADGCSQRAVARCLGRSPSTISRELARNASCFKPVGDRIAILPYDASLAGKRALVLRQEPRRSPKLAADTALFAVMLDYLRDGWSPDTGTRTGSVTVNSNATNPALTIALTGTGAAAGTATLTASPTSLTFGSTNVGSASAAQSVTITNTGTVAATVSGVSVTGDYTQTNGCGSLAAGATCTVSVVFHPTATGTRTGTLTVASNASNPSLTVSLSGTGAGTTATNLSAGKATSESSHNDVYPSGNVVDSNQGTYWESANNAFPQWVQVDLGSSQSASRVVLQLPAGWGARSETLSLQGSTNGTTFTNIVGSATYTFTPGGSTNNTVTITFTATSQRYFRLNITANTGWPAGQISEFQVWNI